MSAELRRAPDYPVTVNDPAEYEYARETVTDLYGAESFVLMRDPLPGSEDFSHVLREVPGAYILLGAALPGADVMAADMNHSPRAYFDDRVLGRAAEVLAELAFRKEARA